MRLIVDLIYLFIYSLRIIAHEHVCVTVLTCCVLRFRMPDVLGPRAGGYKWQYIVAAAFSS